MLRQELFFFLNMFKTKINEAQLISNTQIEKILSHPFSVINGGEQDSLEVRTLTCKLSSLGMNPKAAINCHPGVSQAG